MSGNNGNGITYTLVFFVLLSIILLVVTVLGVSQSGEDATELTKLSGQVTEQTNALKKQTAAVVRLKQLLGYDFAELGAVDETDTSSVIGALKADLQQAGVPGEMTVSGVLRSLRSTLNNTQYVAASRETALDQTNKNLESLGVLKKKEIEQHLAQVTKVETDLRTKEKTHTEEMDRKNTRIDDLTNDKAVLSDALQKSEQAFKETVAIKDETIGDLERANSRLREELDDVQDLSFERADGIVSYVDHERNLVWINLGAADGLRVRTTFSVYTKANHGVGRRDKEDIKARIEVTSIKSDHLAEARILEQDIYRPIANQDPIYSPAFTAGNTEYFSVIGLIDLDGDGVSDRQYLENMVRAAGGEFDTIVDDSGNQAGSGNMEKTTFLVRGEIPEEVTSGDAKTDEANKKMRALMKDLRQEARAKGVRMISLADFKDYLGIDPPPRSWRPGDSKPLNSSGRRPGIRATPSRNSASSGQVSGSFTRSKRLKQQESSGQTSGLYGK